MVMMTVVLAVVVIITVRCPHTVSAESVCLSVSSMSSHCCEAAAAAATSVHGHSLLITITITMTTITAAAIVVSG